MALPEWPIDRSCLPALPDEESPDYAAALARQSGAEDMAVQVLWALSGRRFGIWQVVARPCPPSPLSWLPGSIGYPSLIPTFIPTYWDGAWRNFTCGCGSRCAQTGPRLVHLSGPVMSVVAVTIGTEELDPDSYTLQGDVLYRLGENWPQQNLGKPLNEDGTWSVTYRRGEPVPAGVECLVCLLAKEFLAACSGDKCRLPRNVTGVTRQGVSYQVYDPSRIYANGKTGLAEIDLWLSAINPHALMQAPTVH